MDETNRVGTAELLKRMEQKDAEALNQFLQGKYRPILERKLLQTGVRGGATSATDLLQDKIIQLWKLGPENLAATLREKSHEEVFAFLNATAKHQAIDAKRRRSALKRLSRLSRVDSVVLNMVPANPPMSDDEIQSLMELEWPNDRLRTIAMLRAEDKSWKEIVGVIPPKTKKRADGAPPSEDDWSPIQREFSRAVQELKRRYLAR